MSENVCGTLAISRAWFVGPIIGSLSRAGFSYRLRLFLPLSASGSNIRFRMCCASHSLSHQEKFQEFDLIMILSLISNNVLTRHSDDSINQVTLDLPL
jgi:hypothetical protein